MQLTPKQLVMRIKIYSSGVYMYKHVHSPPCIRVLYRKAGAHTPVLYIFTLCGLTYKPGKIVGLSEYTSTFVLCLVDLSTLREVTGWFE